MKCCNSFFFSVRPTPVVEFLKPRKKLRADILQQYPRLTEDQALMLVPNKGDMTQVKINTHKDENLVVFCVGKNPIFIEHFKNLYPTVYTLWQTPDLLPTFRTWPPVFSKLQKGADLMLPGVVPDQEPSPRMFGNLQKGDLVSVTLVGNKAPVALGKALLSGEDMYMSALKGKGVSVLHIYGDHLWEFGNKCQPPVLPEAIPDGVRDEAAASDTGSDQEEGQGQGEERTELSHELTEMESLQVSDSRPYSESYQDGATPNEDKNNEADRGEEKNSVEQMDELLNFCFACAVKSRVKKSDLPLMTGNFLRNFMMPFSVGQQLDLKKSSYKKLSKFLQSKAEEGYIVVKEQSKGVDVITEVDRTHKSLQDVVVPELVEEEAKPSQTEDESLKPLTFTDVYCVNTATQDLFKEAGLRKGDALLIADVRLHVTNYIKSNNLQQEKDKKMVTLDPVLAHTILKPSEGDLDHMPWEQVVNRVVGKMQAGIAISSGSDPPVIKTGKLDPIKLEVNMRASSKKVTLVDNLKYYGIDVKTFSRLVQKLVACSCSVVQPEQKNKGPQVLIQGNQVNYVAGLLLDKYQIPRRYITGLENAPKQKKR